MTNLDFAGNLGHSIVESKDDRIYIEKGNRRKLSEVKMFTFDLLEREVLYLALSSTLADWRYLCIGGRKKDRGQPTRARLLSCYDWQRV